MPASYGAPKRSIGTPGSSRHVSASEVATTVQTNARATKSWGSSCSIRRPLPAWHSFRARNVDGKTRSPNWRKKSSAVWIAITVKTSIFSHQGGGLGGCCWPGKVARREERAPARPRARRSVPPPPPAGQKSRGNVHARSAPRAHQCFIAHCSMVPGDPALDQSKNDCLKNSRSGCFILTSNFHGQCSTSVSMPRYTGTSRPRSEGITILSGLLKNIVK